MKALEPWSLLDIFSAKNLSQELCKYLYFLGGVQEVEWSLLMEGYAKKN